jgi:hypothetical protein
MVLKNSVHPGLPPATCFLEVAEHLWSKPQGHLLLGLVADWRPPPLCERTGRFTNNPAANRNLRASSELRSQLGRVIRVDPILPGRLFFLAHSLFSSR